jgi:hypothetical protein
MSGGIADALSGFINRSSLPSSGRPTDISRTAQVKLSSLAANSRHFAMEKEYVRKRRTIAGFSSSMQGNGS